MTPAPPRHWFRWSLRTMFVVVTVLACWLGVNFNRARNQRLAVEQLRALGGHAFYDYQLQLDFVTMAHKQDQGAAPREPRWITRIFGVDFFHHPIAVAFNNHGDQDLELLKSLPELEAIWFGETSIAFDGVGCLHGLKRLRELGLWQCRTFDDKALECLASQHNLTSLTLTLANVTDAGLAHLETMTNLKHLDVSGTHVTDAGMTHVEKLTNLERLDVMATHVTDAGVARLKRDRTVLVSR